MSVARRRGSGPGGMDGQAVALWVGIVAVGLLVGVTNAGLRLGNPIAGVDEPLPANPLEVVFLLIQGEVTWTGWATAVAVAVVAVPLLLAAAVAVAVLRRRAARTAVDRAAGHMGRDLGELSGARARRRATRLAGADAPVGLVVGRTVAGGRPVLQSWEDVSVDVWGPRTGKTTSRAVPAVLDAPGAVVATSNKRDLLDATRGPREETGRVWVFDPQSVADETATWWWDPLSYVTDETKAVTLADVWTSAARTPGAKGDAYFDGAGRDLLASLLLAAALDGRPLTQVWLWLTDPTDDEPAALLRSHDYPLHAAAVAEAVAMPDKQRAGVYGTAKQTASFLTSRTALSWVTPAGGQAGWDRRPRFDPHAFARSTDTLYALSREGLGSAGPLVTALTVAVCEAAEDRAKRSPGGRLPVPMVAVLDEAANVCRWRALPDLYSHYGSRGICLLTILQSWSQGVEVWGRDGMRKLWSAATVKVYGGGVHEREFLAELSELIGDVDLPSTSTSSGGRGGRSTTRATKKERVLDVADLGSLPRGRAVVVASGLRPTLVATVPWTAGPHAAAVRASLVAHDPATTGVHVPPARGPVREHPTGELPPVVDDLPAHLQPRARS